MNLVQAEHRTTGSFVLAKIIHNHPVGQVRYNILYSDYGLNIHPTFSVTITVFEKALTRYCQGDFIPFYCQIKKV